VSLTSKEVAEITRLLEDSSFDELYLELGDLKLSLKRSAAAPASTDASISASPQAPSASAASGPRATGAAPAAEDPRLHSVCAPLLGTFYRAPKPGSPPFVEVGSQVQESTVIGIIEVMKLMNTVRAGANGTVSEILARDGALVEYGEPLLRIVRTS
jgi:acetyl-CoA carboxylase biotin carboxyl carrier protein